jgi:hypothetical protein
VVLKAIHPRTDRVERFDEDTPLLVFDQAWWRARPLDLIWPATAAIRRLRGRRWSCLPRHRDWSNEG